MTSAAAHAAKEWNYKEALMSLLIAMLWQVFLLSSACVGLNRELRFALAVDVLILLRLVIAHSRRERGKGWIFYAVLPYLIIPLAIWAFDMGGLAWL